MVINACEGGAYDTVPEVCILLALIEGSAKFFPVVFDEAGTNVTFGDLRSLTNVFQVIVLRLNIS